MNMDDLSTVEYGDTEGFNRFLFENDLQHRLFKDTLASNFNIVIPSYPLDNIDPQDVDAWLLDHQQEHNAMNAVLGLDNPINLLDTDWRKEGDFYDWLNNHYLLHEQIIDRLGL